MRLEKEQFIEYLDKIPNLNKQLMGFLTNLNSSYYEYNEKTDELLIDEIWIEHRQFMIILQLNSKRKVPIVTFRDDITEPQITYEQYNVPLELLEPRLESLQKAIERLGCKLVNACIGGSDEYLWYDLQIPREIFSVKLLVTISSMWHNYNESASKLIEEYR